MTMHASRTSHPPLTTIAHAVAVLALAATAPAHAQTGAGPAAKAEEGLQSVVVTAQKRPQSMQNVPVAVNTVDARAIENQQIVDFSDLTRVAPAMTINQNPNNNTIALRGIGTFAFSIGIESAVSVIVDDVPAIQQLQAFSNLSDIERVEVLRGPQGTLFGKNSSAGVINVVTKESAETLQGHVQLALTSDKERRLEASVSGPLDERTGFRINAYTGQRDGDINNLTLGTGLNGDRAKGVRARLDFKPSATLQGKLIADYNTRHVEGPVLTLLAVPPGAKQQNVAPLEPTLAGVTPGPENRNVRIDTPGYADNQSASLSGTLNWKLERHTLTSVTNYQDWKYALLADYDGGAVDLLAALTRGVSHGGVTQGGPYHSRMLTQELRLASSGEGVLNYLGGLYFSDSGNDRGFTRGPTLSVANWEARAGNRTLAAFTQADYQLAKGTRVNAGLRFNRETIDVDFTNRVPATPVHFAGKSGDNAVTGKLALQQDLAKAVMVYGSFATGYKGAGYDISTGFDQSRVRLPVAPETSKAYEIGMKSRFLQNRLQVNATVFHTDYQDFQAQSSRFDPVTNVTQNAVTNVGELRTRGVELEVAAKPVNTLMLEGSVAYVDAMIKKFPMANCYPGQTLAEGCRRVGSVSVQDLAGKRLANAPRLKVTLGATYNFPLADSGYSGVANLNYQRQSEVNFDLGNNPLATQKAYGVVNGSVGFSDPTQSLKVTLYVNNLFDKSYSSFIADNYNFHGGSHVLTQMLPRNSQRYAGLRVKYAF
ncbi:TonB-dependent receptor [Pseudoduganella namucuonensis]|uniref:Iron complex outermembrane recepter protein n=1 Tax=Pseudoduganella namucuonensis TaxID=1035707 RepID=A0A1I7L5P1_9BURK|nr:TonB-dependent receptor [Pseudoduganella namucuonensis]SFV04824.1 iron complex outermembrane recepter protein [Pseudoduganella namucuonensis]